MISTMLRDNGTEIETSFEEIRGFLTKMSWQRVTKSSPSPFELIIGKMKGKYEEE